MLKRNEDGPQPAPFRSASADWRNGLSQRPYRGRARLSSRIAWMYGWHGEISLRRMGERSCWDSSRMFDRAGQPWHSTAGWMD